MTNQNELEKKLAEVANLPGHVIALNGWLLRTLPKDSRNRFLKDYEKALTVAFHPDRTQDLKDKKRRENFIQSVSNAITYLTSDDMSYEMAIEEVPTGRNPLVKAKTDLENSLSEIAKAEELLRQRNNEYASLEEKLANAGKNIVNLQSELLKTQKATLDLGPFSRLKAYSDWKLRNSEVYTFSGNNRLNIQGVKMRNTYENVPLSEIIIPEKEDFQKLDTDFSKKVEETYLTFDNLYLSMTGPYADYRVYKAKILGGLPPISIREFVEYHREMKNLNCPEEIRFWIQKDDKLIHAGKANTETDITFENRIMPFTTPYFTTNMPILVRFERKGKNNLAKHELI
ncbi:MAG: hypothetical protein WCK29_00845, partial [archaeon]